jgi:hypothetical protein
MNARHLVGGCQTSGRFMTKLPAISPLTQGPALKALIRQFRIYGSKRSWSGLLVARAVPDFGDIRRSSTQPPRWVAAQIAVFTAFQGYVPACDVWRTCPVRKMFDGSISITGVNVVTVVT